MITMVAELPVSGVNILAIAISFVLAIWLKEQLQPSPNNQES